MSRVFFSSAASDRPRVSAVFDHLRAEGIVPAGSLRTADDLADPGMTLRDAIRRLIEDCSMVVVLWSAAAARSEYVNYEIGVADALEKPILLVQLEPASRPPAIFADIEGMRVIDLHAAA